jgi:hypothetical protein
VAAARHLLTSGKDDLVDVQESVSLQADVDERGLHSGEDVVYDPLIDVADDGARAAALYIELGHSRLLVSLGLEDRDAGLACVD